MREELASAVVLNRDRLGSSALARITGVSRAALLRMASPAYERRQAVSIELARGSTQALIDTSAHKVRVRQPDSRNPKPHCPTETPAPTLPPTQRVVGARHEVTHF